MLDVETHSTPPEPDADEDGDDTPSTRVSVNCIVPNDVLHDASVQLFGTRATDPDDVADALLNAVLALGQLLGTDHAWALRSRLVAYDGSTPQRRPGT
jgi:hypothetical protein